jgi:hypothetical protein
LVEVTLESTEPTRLYVDLFELADGARPRLVASTAPDSRTLDYEARRAGAYLLRVQPELLRGGRFTIVEKTLASLGFPVPGLSTAAVQSAFGAPRDAGRRSHHGVDIFAPRGTPVLAALDGRVRTDTSPRGGNVIWLVPTGPRRRLYYAHLDGWAVENGALVKAGDVIGFVGNTGNARTTPPHLHFGVYDRGPVDPIPFLRPDDGAPPRTIGSLDLILEWARVSRPEVPLRAGGFARAEVRARLGRDTAVRVLAAAGAFYRVALPDGTSGYVPARDLVAAHEPLEEASVPADVALRDRPAPHAARIDVVGAESTVLVLGRFGDYRLVRTDDSRIGWLPAVSDAQ